MSEAAPPTYWDYLRLAEMLDCQRGLEADESDVVPDELLFIIVHQSFELWFKMILRELREAIAVLGAREVPEERVPYSVHHLSRVNSILKLCVDQFEVVETLTPQDFLGFRDKLVPASGFQSFQMRELEILLGLPDDSRVKLGKTHTFEHIRALADRSPAGALAWKRITDAQALASTPRGTLTKALEAWLYRTPIHGSGPGTPGDDDVVKGFIEEYLSAIEGQHRAQAARMTELGLGDPGAAEARFAQASALARSFLMAEDVPEDKRDRRRRIRAGLVFVESYRTLPLLAWPRLLVDRVVELEEQVVIFRSRHARMVERVIGRRVGTGGSSGVDYLDKTTKYRVFSDLWTVRTLLLPAHALPPLKNTGFYGFATLPPGVPEIVEEFTEDLAVVKGID